MSAKRKRKKRKKPLTGSVRPEGGLPQSAPASDVDDGWGEADEIFSFDSAKSPDEEPQAKAAGKSKGKGKGRVRRTTNAPGQADTDRLTATIKELNQTDDRNRVFELLMHFVSGTHKRVALFALKKGKVCAWKGIGLDGGDTDAELVLNETPIFSQLVESKSPYLGSDIDTATKTFLEQATGLEPVDIVAAPVTLGERVVGVLYGDAPEGTLFAQQLTMVTQTAGLALQRILQAAKTK